MSTQKDTSQSRSAQSSQAAANRAQPEGKSLPAVDTLPQAEMAAQLAADPQPAGVSFHPAINHPGSAENLSSATAFAAPLQKKDNTNGAPVQFNPARVHPEPPPGAPREAWAEPAAPVAAVAEAQQQGDPAFPSPDAEYETRWKPGMTLLTGAAMAGEAGLAGVKKSGELGLAGAEKSLGLAKSGIEGSGDLALRGAKLSGRLGLAGAAGSLALAGEGIGKSGELALAGAKKSGELGLAGAKKSLTLAGAGIEKSGGLALAGAKKSGELGLTGAKKSLALAGSGIEASGALASAPARWAKEGMANTDSRLKKIGYATAGALGTLVSAPVGLVGAVGSGALGAAGAVGSGALAATGAVASGAAGLAGAVGSGAAGLAGAAGSGALGATGALASGALGATGAVGSAALGATGAIGSGALAATGAVASGALGATGAAASGVAGLAGAVGSGSLGLTGAALAGTGGLAGAATAGSLGLVGMLGGGAVEAGSTIKGLAKENLNKELLGVYKGGVQHPAMGDQLTPGAMPGEFEADGRRKNYGEVTSKEGAQYGMMGLGGAATVGASITDMASKGNVIGKSIAENNFTSPIAGGAEAFGSLGAASGLLGTGAALVDASNAAKEAADSSNNASTRAMAGAQTASSVADATKSTASAAYNIAGLVDAHGAAAAGAQIAAGGAAIATGTIDMLRGGYGLHTAGKRVELLKGIADGAKAQGNTELQNMATDAIATQKRAKTTAKGQMAKGAIAVAGGVLLAASMATPIGWMLLGAGAIVGLGVAIRNWWVKRAKKKEVVIRELGVQADMERYEAEKKDIEKRTGMFTKARKDQLAELETRNPLKLKLKQYGFTSVGHCYTSYTNATANKLYQSGVVNQRPEYEELISAVGLKVERKGVDPSGWKPTPEKIAKALTG